MFPDWDEYTWDESTGCGHFYEEVEHPNDDIELRMVTFIRQPSKPAHDNWSRRTDVTIGPKVVHMDRHGHILCTRYTQGITEPIPYPGLPSMPKLIYWDHV